MIKGCKICGIKDSNTLNFIINHPYPPKFVGFITNYKKSRRYVKYEKLEKLLSEQNSDHELKKMAEIELKDLITEFEKNENINSYILELALYASAYKIARLVRRCLESKVHRTRWSLTSDLDTASVHLFPNCPVAVLTNACSEKGIGLHRGPELPFVTSIDQIELLLHFWSHFF